jgi:hypothetical protein
MSDNDWHGYFLVERLNIGANNWNALKALFESMGTTVNPYPAFINHWRTRLDGDAVIYESRFGRDEVSMPTFKQLLADEFGVDVDDIQTTTNYTSYSGDEMTTIWIFTYNALDRFAVHRFAGAGTWHQSRHEAHAYLAANLEEWQATE